MGQQRPPEEAAPHSTAQQTWFSGSQHCCPGGQQTKFVLYGKLSPHCSCSAGQGGPSGGHLAGGQSTSYASPSIRSIQTLKTVSVVVELTRLTHRLWESSKALSS